MLKTVDAHKRTCEFKLLKEIYLLTISGSIYIKLYSIYYFKYIPGLISLIMFI